MFSYTLSVCWKHDRKIQQICSCHVHQLPSKKSFPQEMLFFPFSSNLASSQCVDQGRILIAQAFKRLKTRHSLDTISEIVTTKMNTSDDGTKYKLGKSNVVHEHPSSGKARGLWDPEKEAKALACSLLCRDSRLFAWTSDGAGSPHWVMPVAARDQIYAGIKFIHPTHFHSAHLFLSFCSIYFLPTHEFSDFLVLHDKFCPFKNSKWNSLELWSSWSFTLGCEETNQK